MHGEGIAIPFAIIFTSGDDKHTQLWSVAHLEALIHGLLLMGLAAVGHLIVLPRAHERFSVTLLITGAYSSITGATIGAGWDVLGVKPGGSVANTVAWLFLGYGTVAVSFAIVWMLWGARRGFITEQDDGRAGTEVVDVPQFGPGPRHEVLVETTHWENWGHTQTSEPVRIHRPQSCEELCDQVRDARVGGFRIKAVGSGYSWSAGAVTDGVLIDMSNLDRPIASTPAGRDAPATVTVEAGMTIHALTAYAAGKGLTFATTTVIPWVQVGGALANGCHGTALTVSSVLNAAQVFDRAMARRSEDLAAWHELEATSRQQQQELHDLVEPLRAAAGPPAAAAMADAGSAGRTPTHEPTQNARAWARPDPSSPSVATIDRGVAVQVLERQGDWAEVMCANGWSGRVDGRTLNESRR